MDTEPLPPDAANDDGDVAAVMEHLSPLGAVVEVELELQAANRQQAATASAATTCRSRATRGPMHAARQRNRRRWAG
jgi:hypothetical protein